MNHFALRGVQFALVMGSMAWLIIGGAGADDRTAGATAGRWSVEKAQAWYQAQPWLVGANFVPSTASNQLEMWQEETFDPETIDRELGWAAALGFNTMRVFLHDIAWSVDPEGFLDRVEQYLEIAGKHGIRTMLVPFDSVWDPFPKAGPQQPPVPGVHNSRWVQSPSVDIQKDPSRHEEVKPYLMALLKRFGNHPGVLAWDLLNEPGNINPNSYAEKEGWTAEEKAAAHVQLLNKLFTWAREARPEQPLTAGVWQLWIHGGIIPEPLPELDRIMLEQSDIITFHSYMPVESVKKTVAWLKSYGRPVLCTEYMSRGSGSTFQTVLPYLKQEGVGAYNWGLVSGRSQTIYPWDSWQKPYPEEPKPWFHDIFRADGTPYSPEEVDLIKNLTAVNKKADIQR